MVTDPELKVKGLQVLTDVLGAVQAEKFVSLILREPFDYTKWQRGLWPRETVGQISSNAMRHRRLAKGQNIKALRRTSGRNSRGQQH